MYVTLDGISIEVIFDLLKALSGISLSPSGKWYCWTPSREANGILVSAEITVKDVMAFPINAASDTALTG